MGLFSHPDPPAPSREKLVEQVVKPAAIEDDNGVITTTYSSIQNSLYDLADRRSKTNAVVLPSGTRITLVSTIKPNLGAYNATYEVTPKNGKAQEVTGQSAAAELAFKLDVLALPAKQRAALRGETLSEAEQIEMAREHLSRLEEKEIHVSGYVTKRGRHVGAYSQIRKILASLKAGGSAHFPDGLTVHHQEGEYRVEGGGLVGSTAPSPQRAANVVASRSAASTHPKSIGGKTPYRSVTKKSLDEIPADNPKLPGTPHPEAVADRAAKARKAAKLPSKKERDANEKRAKEANERRAADESPMPGVIRKPSESDAIRAREGAQAQSKEADRALTKESEIKARLESAKDGEVVYLNGVRIERTPNGYKVKGSLHGKGLTWGRAVRYGSASTAAKQAADLLATHRRKRLKESAGFFHHD